MEKSATTPNTFCQRLTGSGRSAIAVIEVRGTDAWASIQQCAKMASQGVLRLGQVRYGHWTGPLKRDNSQGLGIDDPGLTDSGLTERSTGTESTNAAESIVVSIATDSPELAIEIHCHGGNAAVQRIIADLARVGVPQASASVPAPLLGPASQSLLQREALAMLSRCTTERIAAIAMDQVRGAMDDWFECWASRLEWEVKSKETSPRSLVELRLEAQELARRGLVGVRLETPFRVVLAGPPNVGKSTLMNRLVGWDRSITFDSAGTTRDILHASTVLDGIPIRLTDTAGLRRCDEAIEREGIRRSHLEIQSADVVVMVRDRIDPAESQDGPSGDPQGWIWVLNKSDQLSQTDHRAAKQRPLDILTVATTGEGIDELQRRIVAAIDRRLPARAAAVPISQRQLAIIEKLGEVRSTAEAVGLLRELNGPVLKMPRKPAERPC